MSRGSPSMVALLGILAVAGYQNRDKLSAMMQGADDRSGPGPMRVDMDHPDHANSIVDNLRGMLAHAGSNGGLAGGLTEFLGRFTNPVQSAKAQSWLQTGPNAELASGDLEEILDDETLAELSRKTGLNRSDLLSRLSVALPAAVDRMTPQGRIPSDDEARALI